MTDVEEQGRNGGVAVDVDHAQVVGQVALSGAHKKQPFDTKKKNMMNDDVEHVVTEDG